MVKAMDSKSIGVSPRMFESCSCRFFFLPMTRQKTDGKTTMHPTRRDQLFRESVRGSRWVIPARGFLIQGSNKRKAKKENTKPNSQKALGSITSTIVDVGAHNVIYASPPKSSIEITVAKFVHWKNAKRILDHSSTHHFTYYLTFEPRISHDF